MTNRNKKQQAQLNQAREEARQIIAEAARNMAREIDAAGKELANSERNAAVLRHMAESGDTQLLDLMRQMSMQDVLIGSFGFGANREKTSAMRQQELEYSRWYCAHNGFAEDVVRTYTSFGFGQRVDVATKDETLGDNGEEGESAQAAIDAFWKSPENSYLLGDNQQKELSNTAMSDGEIPFIIWQSTFGGVATLRKFLPEKIHDIKYDTDDPTIPVWYVESTPKGEVYYPDWRATNQMLIDNMPPKTAKVPGWNIIMGRKPGSDVVITQGENEPQDLGRPYEAKVVHAIYKKVGKRSEPPLLNAIPWFKQIKRFAENRATVSDKVATYINKITADGGASEVANIVNRLQSSLVNNDFFYDRNPPAIAGSDWVQNKALNMERMPLDTGAGDAAGDFKLFMTIAAIWSSFPIEFWLPYEQTNRATAEKTLARFWQSANEYKDFWAATFRDIMKVVLGFYKKYNPTDANYTSLETEVSLSTPLDADPQAITSAISSINESKTQGTINEQVAQAVIERLIILLCDAVGVDEAQSILDGIDLGQDTAQAQGASTVNPDALKPSANGAQPAPTHPNAALAQATENLRAGKITPAEFAEYMAAEVEAMTKPT